MSCAVRIEFAVIAELELENFRIVGCICIFMSSFHLELHCFYSLPLSSSNTTLVATLPMADCVPMFP